VADLEALSKQYAPVLASLRVQHKAELAWCERIDDALTATETRVWAPTGATTEYRYLMSISRFNVLPLIVNTLVGNLYADGYRATTAGDKEALDEGAPVTVDPSLDVWSQVWQPNRMDARQSSMYAAAVRYGYSYLLALPGATSGRMAGVPRLRPLSPRRCTARYVEVDDEWPEVAVVWSPSAVRRVTLPDGGAWVGAAAPKGAEAWLYTDELALHWAQIGADGNEAWQLVDVAQHNAGVVPGIRLLDSQGESDTLPKGKIEPCMAPQAQLDQVTFNLLMAQQYGAFRQRWVTGMETQFDTAGQPVRPFRPGVDRILSSDSTDTRFGEFSETNLDGYLTTRDKTMLFIATTAQLPPHALVISAGMSNVSAEALASLENSHRRDVAMHQASFGEAIEQAMRLCSKYLGDEDGWTDWDAQTHWRDTAPRSLAEMADGLGKLATMLEIPPKALWDRVPGVTDGDLRRWQALALDSSTDKAIDALLAAAVPQPAAAVPQPAAVPPAPTTA
jgi:Phage portal protein, SPP1 Gp6-like